MDDSWPQRDNQGGGNAQGVQQSQAQGGDAGGYSQMQGQQQGGQQGIGGGAGAGAMGSGVAGGYESSGQQQQQQPGQPQEKQDWLDKGIEFLGNKTGHNVSDQNADKAGDFMNKEFQQYEGRGLPGVQ